MGDGAGPSGLPHPLSVPLCHTSPPPPSSPLPAPPPPPPVSIKTLRWGAERQVNHIVATANRHYSPPQLPFPGALALVTPCTPSLTAHQSMKKTSDYRMNLSNILKWPCRQTYLNEKAYSGGFEGGKNDGRLMGEEKNKTVRVSGSGAPYMAGGRTAGGAEESRQPLQGRLRLRRSR